MKGKYDVVQLAKKVVSIANENNLFITNLQLQKVMYYIQGMFMNKFGMKAFDDSIECWTYGPVVKKVWNVFNQFGRKPIKESNSDLTIQKEEEQVIVNILYDKLRMNVWDLVDETHEEEPWKNANKNKWAQISDKDMERFFCQ